MEVDVAEIDWFTWQQASLIHGVQACFSPTRHGDIQNDSLDQILEWTPKGGGSGCFYPRMQKIGDDGDGVFRYKWVEV
ncbi:hypothetical protein ACP70R_030990 [Stipagrostis hirtigluma subsp. patula]